MKRIFFILLVLITFIWGQQTFAWGWSSTGITGINNIYMGSAISYENKIKADNIITALVTIIEKDGGRKSKKYGTVMKLLEKYSNEGIHSSPESFYAINYIRTKLETHFYDKSILKWDVTFNDTTIRNKDVINLDYNTPILLAKCTWDVTNVDYTIETSSWIIVTGYAYNWCNIDLTYDIQTNNLSEFKLNINWYNQKVDYSQDVIYTKTITVKLINKKNTVNNIISKKDEKLLDWIKNSLSYRWETYVNLLNVSESWSTNKNYFENTKSILIKCSENIGNIQLSPALNYNYDVVYGYCNNWIAELFIPENEYSEKIDYILTAYLYNYNPASEIPDTTIIDPNIINKFFTFEYKDKSKVKKIVSNFKKDLKIIDDGNKKDLYFWTDLILSSKNGVDDFINISNTTPILKTVYFKEDTYLFFSDWTYKILKGEIINEYYSLDTKSTYDYFISQKWEDNFIYSLKDWNIKKEVTWKDIITWKNINITSLTDFTDKYITIIWKEYLENIWEFYKTINLTK